MAPQPPLPAPTTPNALEAAYIEDQPAGLFPENQDSNFGQYRKIFSATTQDVANQIQTLYNERFPSTSTQFLQYWEEQMGLPQNPPGRSVSYRQNLVGQLLVKGMFSRTRRDNVIEGFVNQALTGGSPPSFGVSGIQILSGIPLYAGQSGSVKDFYKVVEDIPNFHYDVYIDQRITIDYTDLQAELERITPGGLTFNIYTWAAKSGGGISPGIGGGTQIH